MFQLTVYGKPEPAGSKRAFLPKGLKIPVVVDANKNSRPWKNTVTKLAIEEMGADSPMRGPLFARFVFFMPRPKGHYGSGKNADKLKPQFEHARPTGKPDALKLARGCEDALSGVVYADDAQIVSEQIEKEYGSPARVEITVQQICEGSV
jgi:Holliday junction resolvase RusA-like endonuclease